jgi:hypothetical protein
LPSEAFPGSYIARHSNSISSSLFSSCHQISEKQYTKHTNTTTPLHPFHHANLKAPIPYLAPIPQIHHLPLSHLHLSQRISDLIKHDHDELRTYKDNILNAKDDDEKVRWQNQFTWELARHSIAEELVVYPAMEKNW